MGIRKKKKGKGRVTNNLEIHLETLKIMKVHNVGMERINNTLK